jgi:DNA polymerase IV
MEDIRAEGRPVVRVVVKVRFAPFFTKQHGVKLEQPSKDEAEIQSGAKAALARFELTRAIRLLGVRAEFGNV